MDDDLAVVAHVAEAVINALASAFRVWKAD